jgi:hypothetical protein
MTYKPQGIFHFTGESDTGKTTAALGAYHPEQTAYIFDDVKYPPIDESEFGLFLDLVSKYSKLKLLEFYQSVLREIDTIPDGAYDAIIFDTWARFGKSIRYYAKANPLQFREQSTFSANGKIKNMEQWSETHRVEADVISRLSQKCKALFLITHIKPQIIAGARTGNFEPDCGRSFSKVCNMRLWFRHNADSGIPISLVLKRLAKIEVTEQGVKPVNVLPRKITPSQEDFSIWDGINHYWQEPIGNRKSTPNETPNKFELAILDGILTDDQKEVWRAELNVEKKRELEEKALFDEEYGKMKSRALELAKPYNGLPVPLQVQHILPQMKEEFPDTSEEEISGMLGV